MQVAIKRRQLCALRMLGSTNQIALISAQPPSTCQVVIKRRQPGGGDDPGGDGGLVLEGALSPDYYKIREVVYSQYHIC